MSNSSFVSLLLTCVYAMYGKRKLCCTNLDLTLPLNAIAQGEPFQIYDEPNVVKLSTSEDFVIFSLHRF